MHHGVGKPVGKPGEVETILPTNLGSASARRAYSRQQIPATLKPRVGGSWIHSKYCAGVRDRQLVAINADEPHIGSVCRLLFVGSPAAIAGLIVPFGIIALDRKASRALTHVGNEVKEGIAPTSADSDALEAVVLVRRMARMGAPPEHGSPSVITGMDRGSFGASNISSYQLLDALASATGCLSEAKASTAARDFLSAIAHAHPGGAGPPVRSSVDHEQISEAHSKHVDRFHSHGNPQ